MRKNRKAIITAAALAGASIFSARSALAVDYVWDGTDSGTNTNWSNALNWTADSGTPSGATDTATFNTANIGSPANTVDTNTSIARLIYNQDNSSIDGLGNYVNAYTTTISRNATLTLSQHPGGNTPAPSFNPNLLVMPINQASAGVPTAAIVKIVSDTSGSGALGKLTIQAPSSTTGASFNVSGKPRDGSIPQSAVADESFAILDLSGLDEFTFTTAPSFTFSNFGIGTGNSSGSDRSGYSGKVILGNTATINANRITIGGQHDGGTLGNTPVSMLVMGQTNNINTGLSGNLNIGADPNIAARASTGGMIFRAGLTDPLLKVGDPAGISGFQLGSARSSSQGTGSYSTFGVLDTTTASGTSAGTFNGDFAIMRIGEGYNTTSTINGGGYGMLSMGKGTVTPTAMILGATRATGNPGFNSGQVNVGLMATAGDFGQGLITTPGNVTVGQRIHTSQAVTQGILNLANSGAVTAARVLVGENSMADNGNGAVIGIVNLGGGTLTTGQLKGGGTATDVGTKNTRLVNFHGGTLKASTGTTFAANFMENLTGAYVYSEGGTIDTNGQNITVNQPLLTPSGSGVGSISVSDGGTKYRVAPIVVITNDPSDTTGSGATAVAKINSAGVVTGVTVTNPGTGYTAAPAVKLVANGGSSLAGVALPFGGTAATTTANLAANTGGTITKAGGGTLTVPNVRLPGVAVSGGTLKAAAQANPYNVSSEAGTSKVNTLSASSGLIDLTNTKIITQDASMVATPVYDPINDVYIYDGVHGLVQKGRGDGSWNGSSGVTTSQTDATSGTLTSLAVGTGAELRGLSPTTTELFAGQTINGNSTVVMYTYGGDADMDGDLDGDDYFYLDSNVLASETVFGWHQGDFNYDGRLNGDDYFILDSNILQAQASGNVFWVRPPEFSEGSGGLSAVPEPASIGLIGLAATGLLGRRRRAK